MSKPAAPAPLPVRIDVGASAYLVVDDPNMGSDDPWGDTQFINEQIRVRATATPRVKRETLLHETLHAATFFTGMSEELSKRAEERLVNRLAPVLLMILRDNPSLVRYLTDDE